MINTNLFPRDTEQNGRDDKFSWVGFRKRPKKREKGKKICCYKIVYNYKTGKRIASRNFFT